MPSTRLLKEINQASTLEIFAQHPLMHITQSRVTHKATLLKLCMTSKATSQGPTQQVYTRQSLQESLHVAVHRTRSKPFQLQPIFPNMNYYVLNVILFSL
jgi:ABC-type cobalamin transport system ATPase subunit